MSPQPAKASEEEANVTWALARGHNQQDGWEEAIRRQLPRVWGGSGVSGPEGPGGRAAYRGCATRGPHLAVWGTEGWCPGQLRRRA